MRSLRKPGISVLGLCSIIVAAGAAWLVPFGSAVADQVSDPRADFHDAANVTTCAQVGFTGDTILGSSGNSQSNGTVTSDSFFSVTISAFTGPDAADDAQKINVQQLQVGAVIDAVIVKGGNGYNQYPGNFTDMIAPKNNGGNVPQISHWFLCYHTTEAGVGSLQVTKTVVPFTGTGTPVAPIPTTFSVHVVCNDGTNTTVQVAPGSPATINNIVEGSVCVVTETTVLPPGSGTPVYNPPTAATTGVTIAANQTVSVGITNNFANVQVEAETVVATPVVVQPAFTG
jgi:hypothetical protein